MHRKLPLARATCMLVLAGAFTGHIPAQTRQQKELLRQAREASSLIEGTWVLQQRITPSGQPHKQPLQGEFTVKLGVDEAALSKYRTTSGSEALATGFYEGRETGVLDSSMSDYENDAAMASAKKAGGGKDVLFEMNGRSDLDLAINPKSPDIMTLVYRNLELKGTYGVFRQGVRSNRLPTTFKKSDSGFLFFRKPVLTLMTAVLSASDVEVHPEAQGPGSPGDKSHDIVRHTIRGDRMEITYGNGGRDIWVKKRAAAEN